jgi:hypothetical protein
MYFGALKLQWRGRDSRLQRGGKLRFLSILFIKWQ